MAFLYGEVDEEIYMDQPDGFEDQNNTTKKCQLQKALYGTTQAARQWHTKLKEHLEIQEFKKTDADPRVLIRVSSIEYGIIVIYVDDLMMLCKTKSNIQVNQGCVALAKNPVYHVRTKHIDIKFHFLREKVLNEVIALEYKPTEEMEADGLTKALPKDKHTKFITSLNMAV